MNFKSQEIGSVISSGSGNMEYGVPLIEPTASLSKPEESAKPNTGKLTVGQNILLAFLMIVFFFGSGLFLALVIISIDSGLGIIISFVFILGFFVFGVFIIRKLQNHFIKKNNALRPEESQAS